MQFPNTSSRAAALVALSAIALTAACSDSLSSRAAKATLSFAVKSDAAASVAQQQGIIAQVQITSGTHTLDLQSADVTFSKLVFQGGSSVADSSNEDGEDSARGEDEAEHEGDADFRVGASTVSLPLQGGVITPFNGAIPAGTYYGLNMKAEYARLRGTYDGQAFDVTVPVRSDFELRFSPPLVVTGTNPLNVTVNIDVTQWFRDASGNVIDPRQLATDETLRRDFLKRVRASFRAFEDEDRDAHDDSDGEHGD